MKQFFGKILQKDNNIPEKANKSEPILALSISAGVVKASIWELKDHTIEIIGLGIKTYSEAGREKELDFRTLSDKTAESIDLACQVAEVEIKKTFFGLPQSWFKNEDIYPEYNEILEKLASTLDLEAIAYVSIPHAISYYLQYLHKTPTNALLVASAREGAQICYVQEGKIKEEHYITWAGGSLGKNLDKGLIQFTSIKEFPNSIFIYGYGDLESARADIAAYNWTSSDRLGTNIQAPKFLITPKVSVLEEHVDSLSVALVGGKDYARHHEIKGRLDIKSLEYPPMNSQAVAVSENILPVAIESEISEIPFGFVMDKDIAFPAKTNQEIEQSVENDILEISSEKLDIQDNLDEIKEIEAQKMSEIAEHQTEKKSEIWGFNKPDLKPKIRFPQRNIKQIGLILGIIMILFLTGGSAVAWAYWNIPQATVTVYIKPDILEKQINLTASEKNTTVTSDSVPSQRITIDLKDTKEASTTGKRTTGEVAKGDVTVINKTGSEKKFNAGTEIRTANLKFKLSEDVTIASASSTTTSSGETKTYGKSTVKIQASDIGPDSNVDKDTSFSFPSFTKEDFEAVALSKLSGGSKKDIKIVSSSDKTNLSKDLKSDMQQKIPQLLREKVSSDQTLLDQSWQISTVTEKYNKSVGDEANTLSVETSMRVEGFAFKKSDIEQVLATVSEAAVPEGYEFKDSNKNIRTTFTSLEKDGTLRFSATSSVNIIPKIDSDQIAKTILGKKEDAALQTIMSNKKVADVSFEYTVRLPDALQTLPHIQKNIKVVRGVR